MHGTSTFQENPHRCNFFKISLGIIALTVISFTVQTLEASGYPNHPVQLIVPYGAGSGADLVARAIQPHAEKNLGAQLIIGNVPGADTRIGMTRVFKAAPDGYTIGLNSIPAPIIQEYLFDVPYKSLDFTFIYAWASNFPLIFVAENSWKSFDDFIAEARKRPLTMGLPGFGTVVHLLGLVLEKHMNVKFKYVPYPGSAQGFTALAGNHIDAGIGSADAALGLIRAKKVRPILNWSLHPDPEFPDVPLSKKYNLPTIAITRGVFGPLGIPAERAGILEKAFLKAAANPKVAEWAKATGQDLTFLDAKQYRQEAEKQRMLVGEYKDLLKTP